MSAFPHEDPELVFARKILNHIFQAKKRLARVAGADSAERAIEAVESEFRDGYIRSGIGFELIDPTGQKYTDTRSDVQASLSGSAGTNLRIVETMRPIISLRTTLPDGKATSLIIQQGIVVVRSADDAHQSPGSESSHV